jgi:hypothetical protein
VIETGIVVKNKDTSTEESDIKAIHHKIAVWNSNRLLQHLFKAFTASDFMDKSSMAFQTTTFIIRSLSAGLI